MRERLFFEARVRSDLSSGARRATSRRDAVSCVARCQSLPDCRLRVSLWRSTRGDEYLDTAHGLSSFTLSREKPAEASAFPLAVYV